MPKAFAEGRVIVLFLMSDAASHMGVYCFFGINISWARAFQARTFQARTIPADHVGSCELYLKLIFEKMKINELFEFH